MKMQIRKWVFMILSAGMLLSMATACSDDSSSSNDNSSNNTESSISATVNGSTSVSFTAPIVTNMGTYYYISGQGVSNGLKLNIPITPTVGTHLVDGNTWDIMYYPNLATSSSPCTIVSGTITITSYNATTKNVVGTFVAVGTLGNSTYAINNGAFNVTLE